MIERYSENSFIRYTFQNMIQQHQNQGVYIVYQNHEYKNYEQSNNKILVLDYLQRQTRSSKHSNTSRDVFHPTNYIGHLDYSFFFFYFYMNIMNKKKRILYLFLRKENLLSLIICTFSLALKINPIITNINYHLIPSQIKEQKSLQIYYLMR